MKNLTLVEEGETPPSTNIPENVFENFTDIEGEKLSLQLKELSLLNQNLKKGLNDTFIREFFLFSSVAKNNVLPIPKSFKGVDVEKYSIYLEGEVWDKIKLTIRKILHFFFGMKKATQEYLEKEIDKNDKMRKELSRLKKRMDEHTAHVKKEDLVTKIISAWSYDNLTNRLTALRNIYDTVEKPSFKNVEIKKGDLDIDNHFLKYLEVLNVTYDKDKKVLVGMDKDENLIEKSSLSDLDWDFDKIKVALNDTLRLYERKKVFDNLVDKLESLHKVAKKVESQLNSNTDPNNLKSSAEELHNEIRFINRLKDVIFGYNHRIILQIFILCKVSLSS